MEWIQNLVYYYDGRFAKDKMWIFFALNFATGHINQKSGAYIVDGFFNPSSNVSFDGQTMHDLVLMRWSRSSLKYKGVI